MSVVTWADLKQSVINDLNGRDDLADAAIDQLEAVIRRLQRDFFSASPVILTTGQATVVGTHTYAVPSSIAQIERIRVMQGSSWYTLDRVGYDHILDLDSNEPASQSQPSMWAPFGQVYRMYPVPGAVYPLELKGNQKIPIPTDDDTSNFWTTDASDLVRHAALAELYAGRVRDYEAAAAQAQLAETYRISLVSETIGKTARGIIAAHW